MTAILREYRMKIDYVQETDSMYIEFMNKPAFETRAINENINVDLDENKNLIGIDIHSQASKINFDELELKNIPQIKNIKFG